MFIEDEELRTLYQAASAEHLEAIELGLLQLEQKPSDREVISPILRAAHSLKGDSRMLGVLEAESVVHQMEELLSGVDQGQQSLTASLCDRLYKGIDALRKIAREATTGEPAGISVFHIVALLMGADQEDKSAAASVQPVVTPEWHHADFETTPPANFFESSAAAFFDSDPDEADLSSEWISEFDFDAHGNEVHSDPDALDPAEIKAIFPSLSTEAEKAAAPHSGDTQHSTLRVDAAKLDTLMVQADELSVTQLQIARRQDDLAELLNLWEDWSRQTAAHKAALSSQTPNSTTDEALQQFYRETQERLSHLGQFITQLRTATIDDSARLETVANELGEGIRKLRMMPLSSIFNLFPRLVRDLARQQEKQINFIVAGDDVLADKRILEEIKDPLIHLLRNAIDHGIESPKARLAEGKSPTATLQLSGAQSGNQICLEIRDDGRGLDLDAIRQTALRRKLHTEAELQRMSPEQIQRLIFAPGFSTRTQVTEISGRGVGLDVVRANVERLKGSIQVESIPGQGCTFRVQLSMNLAAAQALIVEVQDAPYAIPLEDIETLKRVNRDELFSTDGSLAMLWQEQPISVAWLSDLLELPVRSPSSVPVASTLRKSLCCVVLRQGSAVLGVLVDDFLDQQHIVIKPHSKVVQQIRNFVGATILNRGEVCLVLKTADLMQSMGTAAPRAEIEPETAKVRVLLVEDSVPIRTQMKRILEGAGYDVTAAVDGLDGLNKFRGAAFDAIVSDVEMPNLTGLELTRQVREAPEYDAVPIILVTTLAKEEDQRRGADAGANAYLTKGDFDQSLLLNTLRRLI